MRIIKTIMDLDKELKIGKMFVEPEEMELIEKAFNLNNLTDEEEKPILEQSEKYTVGDTQRQIGGVYRAQRFWKIQPCF